MQQDFNEAPISNEQFNFLKPNSIASEISASQKELQNAQSIIQKCGQKTEEGISKIQHQLEVLTNKFNKTFESEDLNKHKYILHSVLIHDGVADSGHYYTYIKNHTSETQNWIKFNDIHVNEVSEEKVL